tara:strand:- start:17473 stop:17850 length:378 start_codon:yes stop_codon:yes gene_type:complete
MKIIKILLLALLPSLGAISAQETITSTNFKTKTQKGVTVVEFNAPFNKQNNFAQWKRLEHCHYYRVCIQGSPDLKKKYKIYSYPTILIFQNGYVENKFKGNIMLELDATFEEIQKSIDELFLEKF